MKVASHKRFCGIILLAVFIQALALFSSGLTLVPSQYGKAACVKALDVCSHGASAVLSGFEFPAPKIHTDFLLPEEARLFPPVPDEAVASAEPGETGKPPKA